MKANKFQWGKVTLTTGTGKPIPDVKALIYGDSGLCINQYDPTEPKGKFISVSHLNTGKRIGPGFFTTHSARLFCEAVAGLIDWNAITKATIVKEEYPNLLQDIKFIRALVTEYKDQWRKSYVIYKLNGGL